MSVISRTETVTVPQATAFRSVLCGISGSRSDAEVVRQAAALTGHQGRLTLLAVTWEAGIGANAVALLNRTHAADALGHAQSVAQDLGVNALVRMVDSNAADAILVNAAEHHDLLVVGPSGAGRLQGFVAGRIASRVLHFAHRPVLVARRPPNDVPFPSSILLALDGSPESRNAARMAATIARIHHAAVAIAAPPGLEAVDRRTLAEEAALIRGATGRDPVLLEEHGAPVHAVVGAVPTWEASLLVIGSRRLRGVAALRSVSERVAHEAACSVLVAR